MNAAPPVAEDVLPTGNALPNLPRVEETVYLLRREHPQVQLTWASRFPKKVDKLKLRKHVNLFPVKLTFKADYDTNTREFDYGCSAKVCVARQQNEFVLCDMNLQSSPPPPPPQLFVDPQLLFSLYYRTQYSAAEYPLTSLISN